MRSTGASSTRSPAPNGGRRSRLRRRTPASRRRTSVPAAHHGSRPTGSQHGTLRVRAQEPVSPVPKASRSPGPQRRQRNLAGYTGGPRQVHPASIRPRRQATGRPGPKSGSRRSGYRTSSPVTARPMIIRWISLVPSKIVKIVELGAVFAGQRPEYPRGISTDSARPTRNERRRPADLGAVPDALRRRLRRSPASARMRRNRVGRGAASLLRTGTSEVHYRPELPIYPVVNLPPTRAA
jgi:hypothetical protein